MKLYGCVTKNSAEEAKTLNHLPFLLHPGNKPKLTETFEETTESPGCIIHREIELSSKIRQ